MSAIGLLAAETEDREELSLLLGELGHRVDGAALLDQAVESAREGRSRAFLVVDGGGAKRRGLTGAGARVSLMPVLVALKTRRDARGP